MGEMRSDTQQTGQRPRRRASAVAITAIIAATVVTLACIAACSVLGVVFLNNPPW